MVVFTHVISYDVDWDRFCIWVELLIQRRLCPIFVGGVESPDIHECFRGSTGSQRTPGIWGVTRIFHLKDNDDQNRKLAPTEAI